jgi:hypothetical protein
LQHFSDEYLKRLKNRNFHVADIVEKLIESFQDNRVKFVLLVPGQIFKYDIRKRTEHIQKDLYIRYLREVSPRQNDKLVTLIEGHSGESLKQFLVNLKFVFALQLLQHLNEVDRIINQQRRTETLDEVVQYNGMGVLRQYATKSLEFVLNTQQSTLDRFYAKLSKLEMKKGSSITKN